MVTKEGVINSAVSLFILAFLFPLAMSQIAIANITGWNAAVVTIFTVVIPVLAGIGMAVKFVTDTKAKT